MQNSKALHIWLFSCCAFIILIIWVGGLTRLTDSGLSMVDWHPISGIIPPLSEQDWIAEFNNYKQSPEYQKVNYGMSMSEFQRIFYYEYIHRILGRMIGIIFFVPFLIFICMKKITRNLLPKLSFILLLGGLQGLIGWYMVKSGLVDDPNVSQYRLALHLGMAVLIYTLLFTTAIKLKFNNQYPRKIKCNTIGLLSNTVCVLLFIQILSGAFVAGLDAGLLYNTFPLMDGYLIPPGLMHMDTFKQNIFENHTTVQFIHRKLAYVITALSIVLFLKIMFTRTVALKKLRLEVMGAATIFMLVLSAQISLGIMTLVQQVPIGMASAHQMCGILLFSASLLLRHYVIYNPNTNYDN